MKGSYMYAGILVCTIKDVKSIVGSTSWYYLEVGVGVGV